MSKCGNIIAIALCLLTGCSTIDKQIEGWPTDVRIVKHEMGFLDIQAKCWGYLPPMYKVLGGVAMACAEVNLSTRTCDIYHMPNPSKSNMGHEISHCNGGDHDGILQRYFDSWRQGNV